MEPRWQAWAPHAFAPVGINLDKWDEAFYQPGQVVSVPVTLLNDTVDQRQVKLHIVTADIAGNVLTRSSERLITLDSLAAEKTNMDLQMPAQEQFVVYAYIEGDVIGEPVISRRKRGFLHPGIEAQLPAEFSQLLTVKTQ